MGLVDSGKWLCMAAIAEATAASFLIPGAIPLVITIGLAYSDPGAMEKAGEDWKLTAKEVEAMKTELKTLADNVPEEKWSSQDRQAFNKALEQYSQELNKVHSFTGDIGDMLKLASQIYFAFAVLAFALAQILAIQALAIAATSWTIVGAAAIMAAANATAAAFDAIMAAAAISLKAAMMIIVGIVGAGMFIYQQATGKAANPDGSGPVMFQKAQITPGPGPLTV
ncbi:WXG100 family type VII secretion target [Thermomonospora umbrina]|uniref:Type VII secretion system (Wss) protein ESAT-6 n=1 Tax=Thermomonospora umbrina TaxID=111806 RepID=A0A3D9SKW6_9ACTN|nr:WXG100 family type VII secretion target [Thermomonospora umbrina]REE96576.1 type VII secretion system (Wss) protein ESAT-6 [Thermomonospora umbrina]